MSFFNSRNSTLAIILILFLASFKMNAQTPEFHFGENLGSNIAPLKSNISNKAQWLYIVDDFNTPPPPEGLITKVYLKRSAGSSSNNAFQDFKIRIAQVDDTMTAFPNDIYWVDGLIEVYSRTSHSVLPSPNDSWVAFELDIPYYYDGESNIILEVSHTGITDGPGVEIRQVNVNTDNRRIYGNVQNINGTIMNGVADLGLDIEPAGPLDIGISSSEIETKYCYGELHDVALSVENFGAFQVDTFSIGWSIDGVSQSPFGFNDHLDTIGGVADHFTEVTLTNLNFIEGDVELKFWTFLPNNMIDEIPTNDTISADIQVIDYEAPNWDATALGDLTFQFYVENPIDVIAYHWDFGDGNTSTLENPINQYTGNGVYSVILTLTIDHICEEKSFEKALDLTVDIHDLKDKEDHLIVFPNPAKDILEVGLHFNNTRIQAYRIWDIQGRLMVDYNDLYKRSTQINIEHLNTGSYILEVITNSGSIKQPFIKTK